MTNTQFLDWLASLEFFGIKLGLDQTRALFKAAGSPERDLKFIHVAGSNGKGSVCAMIESGLRAAGFRTGFYSSPHLVSPCERFRINGRPVTEDQLCAVQDAVLPAVAGLERNGMKATYFEVTTLIAALLFAIALSVSFVLQYRKDSRELKAIVTEYNEVTEHWKQIDADKQVLKDELKTLTNQNADADDDIASAEKRLKDIESLKEEIKTLEEQLASLTAPQEK